MSKATKSAMFFAVMVVMSISGLACSIIMGMWVQYDATNGSSSSSVILGLVFGISLSWIVSVIFLLLWADVENGKDGTNA